MNATTTQEGVLDGLTIGEVELITLIRDSYEGGVYASALCDCIRKRPYAPHDAQDEMELVSLFNRLTPDQRPGFLRGLREHFSALATPSRKGGAA